MKRSTITVARAARATLTGSRAAPAAERSAFGLVSSYGITLGIARAVSYFNERRRAAPAARGLARRAVAALSSDDVRVHHYLPGIGLALASGATAILRSGDGTGFALSVAFGTGAGLTLDEIMILLERESSYWRDRRIAVAQCAAAAAVAAGFGARFFERGRVLLDERGRRSPRPSPG